MNFLNKPMTNCPDEEVLLDYAAGRLDPAGEMLFARHAGVCPRCAALRSDQAAVWKMLDEWKPEPASEGFNRELWRKIDAVSVAGHESMRNRIVRFLRPAAPLAVACALMVTAFLLDHSHRNVPAPHSAPVPAVMTASDADQLERALDDVQLLREVDATSTKPGVM